MNRSDVELPGFDRGFADGAAVRDRIRMIRMAKRIDLRSLEKSTGINSATLSQIETGRYNPSYAQLESIAAAMGYTVGFLAYEADVLPSTRPWLRAYSDASKREADARRYSAELAVEYVRRLKLKPLPDLIPHFASHLDLEDDQAIEDAAAELRLLASIDEGAVVGNATRSAERLGCLVLPFESEVGKHMGMSLRSDDLPIICVAKSGIPGDRQRFTIAHELGHLMLHGDCPPPIDRATSAAMERQANRFAAAYLGPGDALIETLDEVGSGKVTIGSLTKVKRKWGISIKGLVGRYRELGRISDDQARSLYKQISARGMTKVEPEPPANETAQWLPVSLCRKAKLSEGTPLRVATDRLAASLGGCGDDLFDFADWGTSSAEVIDMRSRRKR